MMHSGSAFVLYALRVHAHFHKLSVNVKFSPKIKFLISESNAKCNIRMLSPDHKSRIGVVCGFLLRTSAGRVGVEVDDGFVLDALVPQAPLSQQLLSLKTQPSPVVPFLSRRDPTSTSRWSTGETHSSSYSSTLSVPTDRDGFTWTQTPPSERPSPKWNGS